MQADGCCDLVIRETLNDIYIPIDSRNPINNYKIVINKFIACLFTDMEAIIEKLCSLLDFPLVFPTFSRCLKSNNDFEHLWL